MILTTTNSIENFKIVDYLGIVTGVALAEEKIVMGFSMSKYFNAVRDSIDVVKEKARWAAAFFVKNNDRYFINNDRGELIIATLGPDGFNEISRTELITPTHPTARRRQRGAVHWSHPAYANQHILTRNDNEIIRASLAKH